MLEKAFWAVSDREPSTPHSRMRLPNISMPTRESDEGADKSRYDRNDDGEQNSRQLIDLPCVIVHFDTAFLLRRTQFHHGGLHDGNERHIRIRHDHDRTDIIGSKFHRNENRRRPSAAPMIAMDAAFAGENPMSVAKMSVMKIPN